MHSYAGGDIVDTGPLTKKRMETVDWETAAAAKDFMKRSVAADKPFFVWYNSTRMHVWTRLSEKYKNITGLGTYADGMKELDDIVGEMTQALKDLGVEDNTIVMFSTDNGAELIFWPDGGNTMFHGEKATTWEGGFRHPMLVKWPAKIKPGQINNEIVALEDWLPTFLAAAGDPDVKEKLLKGHKADGKKFKVHLDGYNLLPMLTGETDESPRKEFFYFSDDGELNAMRYNRYKVHFKIQEHEGTEVWRRTYSEMRMPLIMDLWADPFERYYYESANFDQWMFEHLFVLVPAQAIVGDFLATFKEFPQRQPIGSFSLDRVMEQMNEAGGSR